MVKAEMKAAAEKPPIEQTTNGYPNKMEDEKKAQLEEVVVYFEEQQQRRSPRACVFICLLVLVLLVGFLVVYAIEKSNSDKKRQKGWEYGDDYILVTPSSEQHNNTNETWHNNVSWETKHEYLTLSDAISNEDIIGLRPVFRMDLPRDYVAYWEAKVNDKTGERYVIISAAKQTGDHRLVEEGTLPSPSDALTEQARHNGHGCHRIYRLSPDGLMVCEDTRKAKIVAATRNIDSDSWDVDWRKLDKQVLHALPRLKKEWEELAVRVKKMPQWNSFKWFSMPSGERELLQTTVGSRQEWSTPRPIATDTKFNFQVQETGDGFKAELGLRPGDSVRIPLGRDFREVRIKFVGLRNGGRRETKGWQKRWQKRLCRVLCDLCSGEEYFNMTKIKKRFFKLTKMGDHFIKVKVDADEIFVNRHLEGREIHFRVELRTHGSRVMVINYGIVLGGRRHRRSSQENCYSIPHEELLPRYRQHQRGQCMTGSGPLAWATILGYYQNMLSRRFDSNLSSTVPTKAFSTPLPKTMNAAVENFTNFIFSELKSHCSPRGRGVTSPARMVLINKALEEVLGREFTVVHRQYLGGESVSQAGLLMTKLLESGYPVIVSKEPSDFVEQHYMVVTRVKERVNPYRFCNIRTGRCLPWSSQSQLLVFVVQGNGNGKWESADSRFVAAIVNKTSKDRFDISS